MVTDSLGLRIQYCTHLFHQKKKTGSKKKKKKKLSNTSFTKVMLKQCQQNHNKIGK